MYGELIIIYPKPYSIYFRGTIGLVNNNFQKGVVCIYIYICVCVCMVSDAPAHLLNSDEGTFCLSGQCPGFRVKAPLKPKTHFKVKEGFHVGPTRGEVSGIR